MEVERLTKQDLFMSKGMSTLVVTVEPGIMPIPGDERSEGI
jgi:hypothetical protein